MIAALLLIAQATPAPAVDYGVEPTRAEGIAIGEAYIKKTLADPYSAHFDWPYTFVPINEKVPMFKRTIGYATCLTLNAKNAYGGYVGERPYRIIIRNGVVIDYSEVSSLRFVPDECKALITKNGMRPVAPPNAVTPAP